MTLEFDISMDEMLVFQRRILQRNKMIRRSVWVFRWILPAVLVLGLVTTPFPETSLYVIAWVLAALIYFLWAWLFPRLYYSAVMAVVRRTMKKPANTLLFKYRTMQLDDDAVTITTDVSMDRLKWTGFAAYEQLDTVFILYITDLTGHVVPKRVLGPGESEQLEALLSGHIAR